MYLSFKYLSITYLLVIFKIQYSTTKIYQEVMHLTYESCPKLEVNISSLFPPQNVLNIFNPCRTWPVGFRQTNNNFLKWSINLWKKCPTSHIIKQMQMKKYVVLNLKMVTMYFKIWCIDKDVGKRYSYTGNIVTKTSTVFC